MEDVEDATMSADIEVSRYYHGCVFYYGYRRHVGSSVVW